MRPNWAATACLFPCLAASAFTPSFSSPLDKGSLESTDGAGVTGPEHVNLHLQLPCHECSDDGADRLLVTLNLGAADHECSLNQLRLNGVPIAVATSGDAANGRLSIPYWRQQTMDESSLVAVWESRCLDGEASLLSVRFEESRGPDSVEIGSGFAISFKQKGQPSILRVEPTPCNHMSAEMSHDWLLPDPSTSPTIPVTADTTPSADTLLHLEHSSLEELKAAMDQLHQQMRSKEKHILSFLKDELKACDNFKCLWQTIWAKLPAILHSIASFFSHHKKNLLGCWREGGAQAACIDDGHGFGLADAPTNHGELPLDQEDTTLSNLPVSSTFPPNLEHTPSSPYISHDHSSNEPHESHPPEHSDRPVVESSPAPFSSDMDHHEYKDNVPGLLPFRHDARLSSLFWLVVAMLSMIVLVGVLALLFRLIRRQTVRYRDPRRRAERAARLEERRTKKLYRKAACKYKWRTFWDNFRRHCSRDYEEKREMILEQDRAQQSVMRTEIRTLRHASDLVRDLVRAEEGRAGTGFRVRSTSHSSSLPRYEASERESGAPSTTFSTALPIYEPPPPGYEEELQGEIHVIRGFGYPPSNPDDMTESSIVDCSPRMSFETGRSTFISKDIRD